MISMDFNEEDDKNNQCVLCFNPYEVHDPSSKDVFKLYKLCCKYLHSSFTKESVEKNQFERKESTLPLCSECFHSAVQLSELREKIKLFQKNVSELLLIFSFGILHRREKVFHSKENQNNDDNIGQFIKLNLSSFPECESWISPSTPDCKYPSACILDEQESTISEVHFLDKQELPVQTANLIKTEGETDIDIKFDILSNDKTDSGPNTVKGSENCNSENSINMCSNTFASDLYPLPQTIPERLHFITSEESVPGSKRINPYDKSKLEALKFVGGSEEGSLTQDAGIPGPFGIKTEGVLGENFYNQTMDLLPSENNLPSESEKYRFHSNTSQNMEGIIMPNITSMDPQTVHTLKNRRSQMDLHLKERPHSSTMSNRLSCGPSDDSELNSKIVYARKSHAGVKCQLCGKIYSSKSVLLQHTKSIHRKETTFQCSECDRIFSRKYVLTRHMRTHTGEKPYKCHICDQGFAQRTHLNRHVGKFSCPTCYKKLPCRGLLKSHCKTHSITQSYKCDQCQCSFACPERLKIHQSGHFVMHNYQCRECGKKFETERVAVDHYKNVHFALDFSENCIIKISESH